MATVLFGLWPGFAQEGRSCFAPSVDGARGQGSLPQRPPLQALFGVKQQRSYTANLQILPQATKFISKKKIFVSPVLTNKVHR